MHSSYHNNASEMVAILAKMLKKSLGVTGDIKSIQVIIDTHPSAHPTPPKVPKKVSKFENAFKSLFCAIGMIGTIFENVISSVVLMTRKVKSQDSEESQKLLTEENQSQDLKPRKISSQGGSNISQESHTSKTVPSTAATKKGNKLRSPCQNSENAIKQEKIKLETKREKKPSMLPPPLQKSQEVSNQDLEDIRGHGSVSELHTIPTGSVTELAKRFGGQIKKNHPNK